MATNRERLEQIIREGRSVLINEQIITDVSQLPLDVDLVTTEEEKNKVINDLNAQIADLQNQLSQAKSTKLEETPVTKDDKKDVTAPSADTPKT